MILAIDFIKQHVAFIGSVLFFVIIFTIPFFLGGCSTYLYRAGMGQAKILMSRRSIDSILQDSSYPDDVKNKLKLIQEARLFAQNDIGLNVKNSFTKYSDIGRPAVSWNVSATPPYSFEPKTWWFPIVGSVPYLGFFTKSEAEKLSGQLKQQGWETYISEVHAYSTLGWFNDPVLSSQMSYSDWSLVSLVIHESAHATIWFPDDVDFNESFAVFVEDKGTLQFFEKHDGHNSKEIIQMSQNAKKREMLLSIIDLYIQKLSELYTRNQNHDVASLPNMNEEKKRLMDEMCDQLNQKTKEMNPEWQGDYHKREWNNAVLRQYMRYETNSPRFDAPFNSCKNQWKCFLSEMEKLRGVSDRSKRLSEYRNLR